jgi:hypothetical protein
MMSAGMLLSVAIVALVVIGVLLHHVPNFYRMGVEPPGPERLKHSRECATAFQNIGMGIRNRYEDEDWGGVFSTSQVNGYLQEDFIKGMGGDENLPDGFHDLRVSFELDRIRLGARYGTGFWSTVVSIDLKIWLVENETNLMGLEIVSLRAGGLPVSPQIVLNRITEAARRANIDVKWYHLKGNPVAILKLQADLRYPTIQLRELRIQQGQLIIRGRPIDSSSGGSAPKATSK